MNSSDRHPWWMYCQKNQRNGPLPTFKEWKFWNDVDEAKALGVMTNAHIWAAMLTNEIAWKAPYFRGSRQPVGTPPPQNPQEGPKSAAGGLETGGTVPRTRQYDSVPGNRPD